MEKRALLCTVSLHIETVGVAINPRIVLQQ